VYVVQGPTDEGKHTVCVQVTEEFLAFSKLVGNDLSTPMPMYLFPGMCLYECVYRGIYIYIYMCMYVCMYICMYMYIYVYICICICIYIYVHTYICIYMHM